MLWFHSDSKFLVSCQDHFMYKVVAASFHQEIGESIWESTALAFASSPRWLHFVKARPSSTAFPTGQFCRW